MLAFPFRIFFLLTAAYAVLIVPLWLGIFFSGLISVDPVPLFIWHSHELIFGFVLAAVAGFMLTAICTWTGSQPLSGKYLGVVVGIWLLGRIAFLFPGVFGVKLVSLLDILFLLFLLLYVSYILFKHRNWRNLPMSCLLLLLLCANIVIHWGINTDNLILSTRGRLFSLEVILILIVLVGGRIIPAFTANWLARKGQERSLIKSSKLLDISCFSCLFLLLIADVFLAATMISAYLALLSSVLLLARLLGWKGWLTFSEPLLWVLHLGYFWVILALFLKGMGLFFPFITPSVWIHALGLGAIGTMIIGVMTRVSLGHTGRQLKLPPYSVFSYYLITLAAICRLAYGLGIHSSAVILTISGLAWSLGFLVFIITYWPILTRERIDQASV